MRGKIPLIAFATLLLLAQAAQAQQGQFITSYSAWQQWMPVIFIGVLAGMMIAAIYYVMGAVLNNPKAKERALSELGQAVGTAILAVVIVFILEIFGTGIFPSVPAISPASLSTICYQQLAHSPLAIANPNDKFGDNLMSPTNTICAAATQTLPGPVQQSGQYLMTPTNSIDYGLFSTYIIVANMTSQPQGR